jgi:hypothetical protein
VSGWETEEVWESLAALRDEARRVYPRNPLLAAVFVGNAVMALMDGRDFALAIPRPQTAGEGPTEPIPRVPEQRQRAA